MSYSRPVATLSIRVSSEILNQLGELADVTGRTKSFLAAEAIAHYLVIQAWQVKEIQAAIQKADSKQAKFIDHQHVKDWLNSWGNERS